MIPATQCEDIQNVHHAISLVLDIPSDLYRGGSDVLLSVSVFLSSGRRILAENRVAVC